MSKLHTLGEQLQQFQRSVLNGESPHLLLRKLKSGHDARWDIYRNAYRLRLTEALQDNYPVLQRLLGDDAFQSLAFSYIEQHPSRHPSIRWFGDQLAGFLMRNPELMPHPVLQDLVQMEWALRSAFDAADSRPLTIDIMAALNQADWPEMRFTLHPSACLLNLEWEVEALWRALSQDENADTVAPPQRPHSLLVWRNVLETHWRSLDSHEASLLDAVANGHTFGECCLLAASLVGEEQAAALAAGFLRRWIEDGLLLWVE